MPRQLTDKNLAAMMRIVNELFNIGTEMDFALVLIVAPIGVDAPVKALTNGLEPDVVNALLRHLLNDPAPTAAKYPLRRG